MVFVDLCQEACGGMYRYICRRLLLYPNEVVFKHRFLLDERCVVCWEQVSLAM